ncbi:unnamed protein product [Hydatigera taeniaeformis]|uniref:DUF5734 domain-containing protein n=1 Tax=Hydatigena taeniaeformis TaxID=6205 RepID=A0A0R3WRN2_HYDTA|nr:unnamed protein product [Hydatigera taeniaeformis]
MSERNDLKGTVDHIKLQKFKKTKGYDSKLDKLYQKALKAKPGKANIEVKSLGKSMKFKSFGKKPSPVNTIDYEKIKSLKKSSPSDRVVAFAYPGPDEKSPIVLHAMRFKEEKDYNNFVPRMEDPFQSTLPSHTQSPPISERPTSNQPTDYLTQPTTEHTRSTKTHSPSRTTVPSTRYSSLSSSSLSSSSYTHRPRHHSSKPARGVQSYISTDGLFSPPRGRARSKSPIITIHSPCHTTYVTTTSRFHTSQPPRPRASSAKPRRSRPPMSPQRQVKVCTIYKMPRNAGSEGSYLSSSDGSSDTMTESSSSSGRSRGPFRSRPRVYYASNSSRSSSSSSSSSRSSSTHGPELYGKSIPESRSFVISRCTRDRHSTMRCRPVGGITVTSETPSFTYEA